MTTFLILLPVTFSIELKCIILLGNFISESVNYRKRRNCYHIFGELAQKKSGLGLSSLTVKFRCTKIGGLISIGENLNLEHRNNIPWFMCQYFRFLL